MRIEFARSFDRQYVKLPKKIQDKFITRLEMWENNPNAPQLHDHALTGKYRGYRSINITGDVRALYTRNGETIIIFGFIGTHSQLYG